MSPVVGVLGGGQIGRMLLESANRLNIQVNVLDAAGSPAKQISAHDGHVDGSFKDAKAVAELASRSDVLTVEIEHVDTKALENVASQVAIEPSWKTIRIIQDKFAQKQHLEQAGIAVVPFVELKESTEAEVHAAADLLGGYPIMLKAKTQAYDGRGNFPVFSADQAATALQKLGQLPLYAEQWASFRMEVAVMVVKTKDSVLSFPLTETVHEDSQLKLMYAPPRSIRSSTRDAAEALARKAVATFEGKGVFGVEMFLLKDETLLVNEIAPRPHNSGHYTIEACPFSQYDAHLRAILDLPITQASLRLREPTILLNVLGGVNADSHFELTKAAESVEGASIHLYGKGAGRPARKMGHITVTAPTMAQAERLVEPLLAVADKLYQERSGASQSQASASQHLVAQPGDSRAPVVAVIMGSDSDLPTLQKGLEILDQFKIPFTTRITSAHRTPQHMTDFCRSAADRGIQCIIAAAGGAAHLPGMAAANTALPVIGVPVRGSVLDGVDSLHSIVQMPRGVPVATVGISNSVNAALLAARIVGVRDLRVRAEVERYAENAENEVMAKDQRLNSSGWQAYMKK